jgi:hypothetical protein
MEKHLEIVVTVYWCHEYFGGHRIDEKRFSMENAVEAEKYFFEKTSTDCAYQHTTIQVVYVDNN